MLGKLLLTLILAGCLACSAAANEAFIIDGVHEAAVDLPRVWFLLKRGPDQGPLESEGFFQPHYAFLDTGASGLLLSKESADMLGVQRHEEAVYADVGVGGAEYFDVSEPLHVGTLNFANDPEKPEDYLLTEPYRLQIRQSEADVLVGPIDLIGVPAMAGKTVLLDIAATNNQEFFNAEILEHDPNQLAQADFNVPFRFGKYITPNDPANVEPLPDVAYNPVVDNIGLSHQGRTTQVSWVLDTGGMASLISSEKAMALGLVDETGTPIVTPDFQLTVGGIGHTVELPGFEIDSLTVPTTAGFDLVYTNARVGVHDIGVFSEDTGEFIIIDGIFGSNFLAASFRQSDWAMSASPFDKVIIDMQQQMLGFVVNPAYTLPEDYTQNRPAGDINEDFLVNQADLRILAEHWLDDNCSQDNAWCSGADLAQSTSVNMADYAALAGQWQQQPPCGNQHNPRPAGDLNGNCRVDIADIGILSYEWLNQCDQLNANCRQADIDDTDFVDFLDLAEILVQ